MVQISNTMDTASLVSQLMAVERIPQDQLRQRVTALQSKQTAWSQIGSQVTSLQTAAEALAPLGSVGKLMTASSTNDASVAVRVTGVASASTSNIEVLNLATTHAVVSADTFTDAAASVGGRTLTLTVGGTPTTFTSADGSVGGLVDAVNASGGAVRAKLLQTAPDTWGDAQYITGGALAEVASTVAFSGGPTALCFNSNGRLVDAAAGASGSAVTGLSSTACSASVTTIDVGQATARSGDRNLRVVVQLGGQIRMCDPNRPTLSSTSPEGCP